MKHIRNGVELDPIDVNNKYDFDFQQINYIPRKQILPVSSYPVANLTSYITTILFILCTQCSYNMFISLYNVDKQLDYFY